MARLLQCDASIIAFAKEGVNRARALDFCLEGGILEQMQRSDECEAEKARGLRTA